MKINKKDLSRIIHEEMRLLVMEQVDHEGVKTVVTSASKLLKAIEASRSSLTPAMVNALTPHLDSVASQLESMISNPASYVVVTKKRTKNDKTETSQGLKHPIQVS